MPAYDATRFEPPAPLALVTLRNPGSHAICSDIPMLLDSGADVTLIPQTCASCLGIAVIVDKLCELTGFDPSIRRVSVSSAE